MKIDSVHFYVENAKTWRDWFVHHLGFQTVARTSSFHTCTEVVKSGSVCFLLSSPLLPTSPVAEFLRQYPPGVADVAFAVEDVEAAIAHAKMHGATVLQPILEQNVGGTSLKWSKIAAWGGLTHTLIEREVKKDAESGRRGDAENSVTVSPRPRVPASSLITAIDHIVLNVEIGDLERAVAWYENILDFQPQQVFKIKTDRSALHSQVMVSRNGNVQLPINEPATRNSQIQEFLDVNRGPGIQHIALRTTNIVSAIAKFRASGLSLLSVPQSYYTQLKKRPGFTLSDLEIEAIAQQEILVDWQEYTSLEEGNPAPLLLQIFTQPIFEQPTFFFEFIERRFQAQGFGEGNFRALFEAIESEQIKRGTLQ
ncbi:MULTISPECIES: 4-hydroxyphenylpyruvate dioxygenase [Nostoc]|uniref:4-hydroxyphenylpyruvate dioxygenase n=1 Tax=Nostoc paludosum FACHB-159 TaxID=2692908 RepID=A0ABR8K0G9_9NOSO|nr:MULTISPECIES: 4-hydroxyphenylpyruvate dioxygenase [Nostoc]MBD2676565.1 4-hydroxyphenylpyruvate dioxygenase [Nostoc sp. FACHB-857]MBD2732301.1 4-hydroxyphenylpyruvate dioxygenase [Nostoc paludosum FACHB-159]